MASTTFRRAFGADKSHPFSGSKRSVQVWCEVPCADMEEKRPTNEKVQKFVTSYTRKSDFCRARVVHQSHLQHRFLSHGGVFFWVRDVPVKFLCSSVLGSRRRRRSRRNKTTDTSACRTACPTSTTVASPFPCLFHSNVKERVVIYRGTLWVMLVPSLLVCNHAVEHLGRHLHDFHTLCLLLRDNALLSGRHPSRQERAPRSPREPAPRSQGWAQVQHEPQLVLERYTRAHETQSDTINRWCKGRAGYGKCGRRVLRALAIELSRPFRRHTSRFFAAAFWDALRWASLAASLFCF